MGQRDVLVSNRSKFDMTCFTTTLAFSCVTVSLTKSVRRPRGQPLLQAYASALRTIPCRCLSLRLQPSIFAVKGRNHDR